MNIQQEYAWIAAALDFEGTIGLYKGKTTPKGAKRGFVWRPKFILANTNKQLVEKVFDICRRECGTGYIGTRINNGRHLNWSDQYTFQLHASGLRILLPKILPHLIAKKQQAELLIKALNLLSYRSRVDNAEMHNIYEQMKRLNSRGRKNREEPKGESKVGQKERRKKWQTREIQKLELLYPSASWGELRLALPRHPESSIKAKARELALSRPIQPQAIMEAVA